MSFTVRAVPQGYRERIFRWLVERTDARLTDNARGIACIDERDGRIVGMVTYDRWTKNSCEVSIAIETAAAWRRLARPAFAYPFLEAQKGVILCGISDHNARSLAFVRHLGFRELCVVRDQIAVGVDLHLFEMRREECRFLKES